MKRYKGQYQIASGAYGKELYIPGKAMYQLNAGNGDSISIFAYDKETIAVLSVNYRMEYAGLELIKLEDMAQLGEIFLQSEGDFSDMELRKSFFDYGDNRQADILAECIY
jgi:hypothetical protein